MAKRSPSRGETSLRASSSAQKTLFGEDGPTADVMPWDEAAARDVLIAEVVFNRPLTTSFDYFVPDELRPVIQPGQRVRVPFGRGNRLTVGYCVALKNARGTGKPLKPLRAVLDTEPMLSGKMLELTRWMADRYLCGWGQVLESVIPAAVKRRAGTRWVVVFRPADGVAPRLPDLDLPPKQRAVLERLCQASEPMD
ncbi:MAG TPA: primosomal protein N', partial [Planctomycetaceae bacterium]|nr:primosomal protein N' [Planctomycetaceae bacterium]